VYGVGPATKLRYLPYIHSRFHSTDDSRLPEAFKCFSCRVKADPLWDLIKTDLYPKMMVKFKELALFRYELDLC
jgi:hypothetical protein